MKEKVTQIVITYKDNPHAIFSDDDSETNNRLVIRLQPNEGIQLEMLSKKQCMKERSSLEKRTLNLDFLDPNDDSRIVDAYERLLLEVINGDQWLFVSRDEVEASWQWCDDLLQAWSDKAVDAKSYSASWGHQNQSLIESGRSWYRLVDHLTGVNMDLKHFENTQR